MNQNAGLNDDVDQNGLHDDINSDINMAEERTLLPSPFTAAPDEDASEFWRRLQNYCTYKSHDDANKLRPASIWLNHPVIGLEIYLTRQK